MRQIVLDTETTGLEPGAGHRIIEIGAVEIQARRLTGNHFHRYINPERDIDAGAQEVHGISAEFLSDKPLFADVVEEFLDYIDGAELIIHNAAFDVGFLDHELRLAAARVRAIERVCTVTDSLAMARHKHPGQMNSLDALCRRYGVDNSARTLHGALLDAEILADVFLLMTGGQTALFEAGGEDPSALATGGVSARSDKQRPELPVVLATPAELAAHETLLDGLDAEAAQGALWRALESTEDASAG
ncbi:MAG: DNA polymerase III subunit epsilon [Pseudomonadota bacterium]